MLLLQIRFNIKYFFMLMKKKIEEKNKHVQNKYSAHEMMVLNPHPQNAPFGFVGRQQQ